MTAATATWSPDGDGWLVRQQSWGEPDSFPFKGAVSGMGRLYALDWATAAKVDALCGRQPQLELALAA